MKLNIIDREKAWRRIRQMRKEMGLTQIELCELTGYDKGNYSRMEKWYLNIPDGLVERVERMFNKHIDEMKAYYLADLDRLQSIIDK